MPSKKFARFASMKVKTLSVAVASSLLIYSGAQAAGLGKLNVLSSLGQPLRAEIELTSVSKEDIGHLMPRLASQIAFEQAKVDFNSTLSSLRFAIEERGARQFVLITSPQAINEPFLELLVELTSSSGRLVREYSLLLDPAELNVNQTPTRVQENVGTANKSPTFIQPAIIKSLAKVEPNKRADQQSDYYQIKEGDTLGKIAEQFKAQGISLEQMLVALQRSNPTALINNNINLIRAGSILVIPKADEVRGINPLEAKQLVLGQSTDFNAYRNKLADQVLQTPVEESVKTKKIDSGKITAKVVELPTTINEAKDKLKLSKEPLPEQATSNLSEEEKIAKQKTLSEANTRLKELEQNTAKLQKMLDLRAQDSSPNSTSTTQPPKPPATSPNLAELQTSRVTPESQPLLWKEWISYLPYGAALLALLGALGIYFSKAKKVNRENKNGHPLLGLGTTTNDEEPILTNQRLLSPETARPAELSSEEELDPIAQAEVYMTYGHDDQAEETLIEVLHAQPDHHDARLKLLEIYLRRQDVRSFETIARQLHEITEGVGADWEQVVSLGVKLDPENPLYTRKKEMQSGLPSSAFALAAEINQSIEEVLQPGPEIKSEIQSENKAALDFPFSASSQEKLVQVETKTPGSEEETAATDHLLNFDFSGIDLELPKASPEVHQERI